MLVGATQAVLTGEILPPAQPKPLKTYSSAMRQPGAMSELLRVIASGPRPRGRSRGRRRKARIRLLWAPPAQSSHSCPPTPRWHEISSG